MRREEGGAREGVSDEEAKRMGVMGKEGEEEAGGEALCACVL